MGGGHDNDLVSCGQHDSHDHIQPVTRLATDERGEGEGGGKGGGMITTLLHAANTTTSSHDHSQHDQSPASQRVRGGRGGGGGMVTTLFHAASTGTTTSSHPRGERGRGEGEGKGGGNDNDRCFTRPARPHLQSPTRPARPVTRLATGERGEGGGGGYDNDLVLRGQHDHIHSRPHPVEFRHSIL